MYLSSYIEINPPTLLQAIFSLFPCTCRNPPLQEASQPFRAQSRSSTIISIKKSMQDFLRVFSFHPQWKSKWDSQLAWNTNKRVIWAQRQSKQVLMLKGLLPAVSHNRRAAALLPASPVQKGWDNAHGEEATGITAAAGMVQPLRNPALLNKTPSI